MSIELGKFNQLEVVKEVDFGVYLDGGEEGEILLPTRYVPEDCKIGDLLNVFLYLDMDERLIATTLTPLVQVGQFACLEVSWVNQYGAFLNWGLLPCRRRRDAGHRRPHLSAAGAFWGALRPGCAGRRSLRAHVRLCGDVAAVRSLLQKAQKSFRFLLTEPRGYGIILLAACFDSQLQTISEPNGITTCARSSGG